MPGPLKCGRPASCEGLRKRLCWCRKRKERKKKIKRGGGKKRNDKKGKKKNRKKKITHNEHPLQQNTHSEMALLPTRETDVRCKLTMNVKRPQNPLSRILPGQHNWSCLCPSGGRVVVVPEALLVSTVGRLSSAQASRQENKETVRSGQGR